MIRHLDVRWKDGAFWAYAYVHTPERLVGGRARREPFTTSSEAWAWLGMHTQ